MQYFGFFIFIRKNYNYYVMHVFFVRTKDLDIFYKK